MYIPLTFLGEAGNLCVSSSGADSVEYLLSGSTIWKVNAFTTTGSHTYQIHSGSALHRLVIIGGGGGGGIAADLDRFSGGGGAGGFLFLDNLPMASGSYNLYVGSGGQSGIITDGYTCSTSPFSQYDLPYSGNGESSSFDYTYVPSSPDAGYYVPTSKLSAYGGGAGSSVYRVCPDDGTSLGTSGGNGASGGGGSLRGDGTAFAKKQNPGIALYNLTDLPPHGFDGGEIIGTTTTNGSGGGGASSTGSAQTSPIPYGGDGVNLGPYTGQNITVCVGGPGGDTPSNAWNPPSYTSGSGGAAAKDTDTASQLNDANGRNGLVLVMHKLCELDLDNCTLYNVDSGVSGGDITYIPCGGGQLESASLGPNVTTTLCAFETNDYPTSTGTVTLTQINLCNSDIPVIPLPTCNTGSQVTAPSFIYDWELQQKCYPTPSSCQRNFTINGTLTYTDTNGTAVTQSIGGGFVDNTGQVCARTTPAPTISDNGTGEFGTTQIVKSDLICGYYCEDSFIGDVTPGSIVNEVVYTSSFYDITEVIPLTGFTTSSFSLEVWSKNPQITGPNSYDAAIGLRDGSGDRDFIEVRYKNVSGLKLYGNLFEDLIGPGGADYPTQPYGDDVVNDTWYHSVLTWSGSGAFDGVFKYYRDGNFIGQATGFNLPFQPNNPRLYVGQNDENVADDMYIGEYRVYPFDLSPSQSLYNYNNTRPRYKVASEVTPGYLINVTGIDTGSYFSTSSQLPTFDWVTSSMALEVWSKDPAVGGTYDTAIGLNDQAAGGDRDFIEVRYRNVSGVKLFGNILSGSTDTVTQPYGNTVTSDVWYHSILTWDTGSGQMLYYRDGSLLGSASVPTITTELNGPYYNVGKTDTGTLDSMYIGEYRIYPFALNNSESLDNYNVTKGRYGY